MKDISWFSHADTDFEYGCNNYDMFLGCLTPQAHLKAVIVKNIVKNFYVRYETAGWIEADLPNQDCFDCA